jgi:hypothetical protein
MTWPAVHDWYSALHEFQRVRLGEMGLRRFFEIPPFYMDMALLTALVRRWDPLSRSFVFRWGQMMVTLEDVARITGLAVHGRAVTVETPSEDYRVEVHQLLHPELGDFDRCTRLRLGVIAKLAASPVYHRDGPMEPLEDRTTASRAVMAAEPGEQADRDLRMFLMFAFGRLLFVIADDHVSCQFLSLIADLPRVGDYAWGSAVLCHLMRCLTAHQHGINLGGYIPLLQVFSLCYFFCHEIPL